MDQENGSPVSEADFEPLAGGSAYRHFGFLAVFGMVYGIVVASVLSTGPTAITFLKYVVPAFAVTGIVAGAWYGYFFNISNHCTGGQLLCGIIGGLGAAAVGTLVVSLVMAIVGTLAGFAAGWIVGSFLSFQGRGAAPLIGAGVGAVIQAGWASPVTVVQAGALGGVLGALAGPAFLADMHGPGVCCPTKDRSTPAYNRSTEQGGTYCGMFAPDEIPDSYSEFLGYFMPRKV